MGQNKPLELSGRVESFDVLAILDKLHQDGEKFSLLKDTLCDVLSLDDILISVAETELPGTNGKGDAKQRIRRCLLKKGGNFAQLGEFSDGTLVVVALLSALLAQPRLGPLVCIEELENSLHPGAVAKLVRFLQEYSREQPVLLTTHSPYLLNGVDPDDVIVAVADQSGATHFEKPSNRKAINGLLKRGYMSFGDLLATNFKDVL